jgi:gliding motility-associatede transport system auxiliary component
VRDPGRWLGVAGLAAAMVIAFDANILAARHYRRWDFTEAGLYTLSRVTEQTLSALGEPVEIYVLLSDADPLKLTMQHLLEAYRAHTSKLTIEFIDPDRNPARFLAVQQQYGIAAGKTGEGRLVTDATVIVVHGDKKHFIRQGDLVAIEMAEEARARPQAEEALTGAIRKVLSGRMPKVCVTSGHGEPSIKEGGDYGLLPLKGRLDKLNYELAELEPLQELEGKDTIDACDVVIVAAPRVALGKEEVKRLTHFVQGGGSALVFVGRQPDEVDSGYLDTGLAPLVALAGVRRHDDYVFERDPQRRPAVGSGETFIAEPLAHPVTQDFVDAQGVVPILLTLAASLEKLPQAEVTPVAILQTSESAFGMVDFESWAKKPSEPEPTPDDHQGPLVLGYAAELSQSRPGASHGARIVVLGSSSPLYGANWQDQSLRGTALFVESAVAWLAAEPSGVDIPKKPAMAVGYNITEDVLTSALWRLVLCLPLASALGGVAVALRRRATERRGNGDKEKPKEKEDA